MNKKLTALMAAFLSTICIAVAIVAIGGAALFNPNGVAAAQSASQVTTASPSSTAASNAEVQQLQGLVAQYQGREKQYQAREVQYQQQLQQEGQQIQQAQQQMESVRQLLFALQQRGLIAISGDGQIVITSHGEGGG
jgi:hypothetical protein